MLLCNHVLHAVDRHFNWLQGLLNVDQGLMIVLFLFLHYFKNVAHVVLHTHFHINYSVVLRCVLNTLTDKPAHHPDLVLHREQRLLLYSTEKVSQLTTS